MSTQDESEMLEVNNEVSVLVFNRFLPYWCVCCVRCVFSFSVYFDMC